MKTIPILPTVQAAYRFVFAHLGAIIGLIWLPMVLVTVMGFFVEQRYYAALADAFASDSFAMLGPATLSMFFYFVAMLLLYAVMFVPLVQLALGQRKDSPLVHFAFGALEWRLFRALIGLMAFLLFPALILAALANLLQSSTMAAPVGIGLVLGAAGIVYVALRFVFLMPSVAVSEEGPVLPRAWHLSSGNFWRILAILLCTTGPLAILVALAQLLLEGASAFTPAVGTSSAVAAAQLHSIVVNMPLNKGIDFLVAPLVLGLGSGASAAALTALRSEP
jgi:hypothetical protein